ncbi:MAG: fumarylacetoacetate hydrolase family protein [Burkholderiaceae bacterium]
MATAAQPYLFPPCPQPVLPIRGRAEVMPVHRIYCIGRNYEAHAVEMGHDPNKEPPFFFQKNADSLVVHGDFPYPPQSQDVHHEVELVVAIGKAGSHIPVAQALDHVIGYAVGLDMTCRDLQAEAKKLGRPWEPGKSFEHSSPCSELVLVSDIGHPAEGEISLKINGETRQVGDLNQLIWKVPELVSVMSNFYHLQPGDLIFSGTPAGIGPVHKGDRLECFIQSVGTLSLKVSG